MTKKDAYYFSHDANARHDPNICDMRADYGMEGYGIYWAVIEMLREQEDFKLNLNHINAIAMQTQCEKSKIRGFIEKCINDYKLYKSDGVYFWSDSLLRRMEAKETKSEKARQAAEIRWNKASAKHPQCDPNALKESKVKEKKEKKTKEKPSGIEIESMWVKLSEKLLTSSLIERTNPPSPKQWGKNLKTFYQREKIKKSRIKKVLDWYCSQYDKEANPYYRKYLPMYVPQTNSMSGFCDKFYDIECAMERDFDTGETKTITNVIKRKSDL